VTTKLANHIYVSDWLYTWSLRSISTI